MGLLPDLIIPLPIFYAIVTIYIAFAFLKFMLKRHNERYYEERRDKQRAVKSDSSVDSPMISCSSSNCVRCTTYDQTLARAHVELGRIPDSHDTIRIKNAVTNRLKAEKSAIAIANDYSRQNPNVLLVKGLKASPYWPDYSALSPDVALLEDNFAIIFDELEKCLRLPETDSLWTYNSTPAGAWDVFHLYNQGKKIDAACDFFPKTCEIIEGLQSFIRDCAFGNASFSVIHSNTLIAEHYGPCNVRIRCHLGKNQ